MTKKWVDGIITDMTAEEQAQYDADDARITQKEADAVTAKEAHDALKASAKAKLIAGEALTEEEANTIVL
jgi:hypothetical protein